MATTVFDRLEALLRERSIAFTTSRHEPVFTSEDAARVRGTPLSSGAKALIVKAGERFVMLVMPADRRLDGRKARTALNVKGTRFASAEEVVELTGLRPGSIPPFGSLFGLDIYCDPALSANETINFNAGDHTISMHMRYTDYLAVAQPRLNELTQAPGPQP